MGLVGLPNVGKSTTFNILSKQAVPAENYPFCTIGAFAFVFCCFQPVYLRCCVCFLVADPHEARMNGTVLAIAMCYALRSSTRT